MNVPREKVFAAVWEQAKKANTAKTPFATMSRRMIPWSAESDIAMPAMFMFQDPQQARENVNGLTVWRVKATIIILLNIDPSDYQTVVSTALNDYADAIEDAFSPPPGYGSLQTLGGLVTNCSIDGSISVDEGLLAPPSSIVVPITILTGI